MLLLHSLYFLQNHLSYHYHWMRISQRCMIRSLRTKSVNRIAGMVAGEFRKVGLTITEPGNHSPLAPWYFSFINTLSSNSFLQFVWLRLISRTLIAISSIVWPIFTISSEIAHFFAWYACLQFLTLDWWGLNDKPHSSSGCSKSAPGVRCIIDSRLSEILLIFSDHRMESTEHFKILLVFFAPHFHGMYDCLNCIRQLWETNQNSKVNLFVTVDNVDLWEERVLLSAVSQYHFSYQGSELCFSPTLLCREDQNRSTGIIFLLPFESWIMSQNKRFVIPCKQWRRISYLILSGYYFGLMTFEPSILI